MPRGVSAHAPAPMPAPVPEPPRVVEPAEPFFHHRNGDAHGHHNGNGHATPSRFSESPVVPPRPAPAAEATSAAGEPQRPARRRHRQGGAARATITARLLEIVRDRTGYPIETLGLDLDIEADLGIDSIKRVEILGKLRDEFPALKGTADSSEAMDALARARTLGAIVDRMAALAGPSRGDVPGSSNAPTDQESKIQDSRFQHGTDASASGPDVPTGALSLRIPQSGIRNPESLESFPSSILESNSSNDGRSPRVERRVLEAVAAPLPRHRRGLMAGGRVVVTDDGRGVAAALAGRLEAAGVAVERLGNPERPVDWTSPSAIDAAVDEVRVAGADRGGRARDATRPAGVGRPKR